MTVINQDFNVDYILQTMTTPWTQSNPISMAKKERKIPGGVGGGGMPR